MDQRINVDAVFAEEIGNVQLAMILFLQPNHHVSSVRLPKPHPSLKLRVRQHQMVQSMKIGCALNAIYSSLEANPRV
jgi:hypothetical protein